MDDDEINKRAFRELAAAAEKVADSMRRLQSAFVVFNLVVHEGMESIYPADFRDNTSAAEIAECAIARAQRP